jgi:hypothetical protein
MTLHIKTTVRLALLDLLADAVDAGSGPGTIEIRSGSQPANADTGATGTLLATFTCADPAFDAAVNTSGVTSVAIDAEPDLSVAAVASGTASWARVKDSDGNVVFDGTVGTSGTDFVITSTTITSGQTVTLVSGAITLPA